MINFYSIIADPTGGWVALIFILIFVAKAILALVGADTDGDVEIDSDIEIEDDIDTDSDGFGFSRSDILSLKGLINFGVGFSLSWALFGLNGWFRACLAVFVGFITLFSLIYVYRSFMKLEGNNVSEKGNDLLNRTGTVYVVNDNYIVIQLSMNGRITEMDVLPDNDNEELSSACSNFHTGEKVYISKIVEGYSPNKEEKSYIYYIKKYI